METVVRNVVASGPPGEDQALQITNTEYLFPRSFIVDFSPNIFFSQRVAIARLNMTSKQTAMVHLTFSLP